MTATRTMGRPIYRRMRPRRRSATDEVEEPPRSACRAPSATYQSVASHISFHQRQSITTIDCTALCYRWPHRHGDGKRPGPGPISYVALTSEQMETPGGTVTSAVWHSPPLIARRTGANIGFSTCHLIGSPPACIAQCRLRQHTVVDDRDAAHVATDRGRAFTAVAWHPRRATLSSVAGHASRAHLTEPIDKCRDGATNAREAAAVVPPCS
jgi:hypothetical protein